MKIEIDKIYDRYAFSIKKNDGKVLYSSSKQYFLIPNIKSSYQYAWEAYRDAKRIPTYHIASEEFVEPVVVDVSAETMLEDHYTAILKQINLKAKNSEDQEDKDNTYAEIKMITTELLTVKDKLDEGDKGTKKIDELINYLRKTTQKYFPDLLEKDKQEKEKADEASQQESMDLSNPLDPMGGMGGGMGEPMPMDMPQGSPMAMASKRVADCDDELEKEVLEDYAEKVCKVIQSIHPDAVYDIKDRAIRVSENEEPILYLMIDSYLMLNSIVPSGRLSSIYPYHKSSFYQRYWKPIVESVGHIVIDNSMLLVPGKTTLPDLPSSPKSFIINGWDIEKNKQENVNVSFKGYERDSIWLFEASEMTELITASAGKNISEHVEEDYTNALVKCINPNLKSIYGRVGMVTQVIPGTNYIEVTVDFFKGLGNIRLTEQDIEIEISDRHSN